MKPPDRKLLGTLALIASSAAGCGPDHDRQMVFTAPRTPAARAESKDRAHRKGTPVGVPTPAAGSLSRSNGVDVPLLRPD